MSTQEESNSNIYVNQNASLYKEFLRTRDSKTATEKRIDRLEFLLQRLQAKVEQMEIRHGEHK